MHCDSLSLCENLSSLADKAKNLIYGGCAAQCFAIFTQGDEAAFYFEKYLKLYKEGVKRGIYLPVTRAEDLKASNKSGVLGGILTVENLGFLKDLSYIADLKKEGVCMASLVWNYENEFAYSNGFSRDGRALKERGREALSLLDGNRIIVDISHLSDGGADEILNNRKIPVVASHSDSAEICGVSRNLTDGQIKKIADCGGVVGVNFYKKFLGSGATFELISKHLKHIIDIGGESVAAIGGDFDGMTPPEELKSPRDMPTLFGYLGERFSYSVIEKFAYKNFLRVFEEVCG